MKIIKAEANTSLYIRDGKVIKRYTYTPENITKLSSHEIIVFGSNLRGKHSGGLAKICKKKFGAIEGISEGRMGQCYAFPTLDENFNQRSKKDLIKSIEKLIGTANNNTDKIFLVTKVGCGITGYSEEFMKELFNRKDISANIILPKGWRK